MTDAKIGYGATFSMENDTAVMTKLAEVIEIGLPNPQTDDVDATHFESPGRQREYIAGLIDNGEITVSINYVPGSSTDALINAAQASGEARAMAITIPADPAHQEFTFDGIVKGYEKTIPIDDRMTATLTIRVAGAVTQAAVA